MDALTQKLVDIASTQVGVREEGGNNKGSKIVTFQGATWLAPGAWPWCAAFGAWCMREWLKDASVRQSLGLTSAAAAEAWRCKDASAFGWMKWADKAGPAVKIFREDKTTSAPPVTAMAGDLVIFDFSHFGICRADQISRTDKVNTIEGNTNGKGERDSAFGDGVWLKSRNPKEVLALIRMIKIA